MTEWLIAGVLVAVYGVGMHEIGRTGFVAWIRDELRDWKADR